jgi:hypothetical protein
MGSKRFRNKLCAYCGVEPSTTGDHVVARAFFLEIRRGNLPQVPACAKCNSTKSSLEHYLATVLPFGGRNPDAIQVLNTSVEGRLKSNQALSREISATLKPTWQFVDERTLEQSGGSMEIRLDKFRALCTYIAKGLTYYHWKQILPDKTTIACASFLTGPGVAMLDQFFLAGRVGGKADGNLGEHTCVYEGVQGIEDPQFTVWKMRLLDVRLSGDPRLPNEVVDSMYVITASINNQTARQFIETIQSRRDPG